ncbi:MAG: 1-deoxy-D-xylulose-5-phosphate synthase [Chlamydiae bacterium]|nr:1-deoxy-D-xylulose-5-phosphate synthase [Chlamydiota bacterium]
MNYPLLSKIHKPADLQQLSLSELKTLASEVRNRIIDVVAVNGGHLASNLGSVELTLALHLVFDSPKDKFIFDVSHQTYTHKLITGRNDERFDQIRKTKGLCGFTHPDESPHDHFFAGHAGAALSSALGVAHQRDLCGGDEHLVPVIGDATLSCGLSIEALNNLSRSLKRFVVILNDNKMSISHNVGGMRTHLSRLLNNPTTSKWVHEIESLVSKIPYCGSSLAETGLKFSESIKNLVSPAPFFEQFGLSYIGPIDGHDIKKLIAIFSAVKNLSMPVIIHLNTQKGHGLTQAENDPVTFHGVKPFDPATCEFLPSPSSKPTFPKLFGQQIVKMGESDPTLVVITPAMSRGSCLDSFMEKFPDRSFDVGIAEGHAITFAGGIAKNRKLKVICSIYSTFLQRGLDNLFHDVCLQRTPVIFAIDRAGFSAADGPTHHGIYEMSFLKTMPNMVICQPRDGHLLRELLESAFSWDLPTAIRYPNMKTEDDDLPLQPRPLGKAELLADGEDLLIIALGHMCETATDIREQLLKKGISAAILDPIFVKPLDADLLGQLFCKHTHIVTIEEHSLKGGLGSEINDFAVSHDFGHLQILNFGIPEIYVEQGSYSDLINEVGLNSDAILKRIVTHFSLEKKKDDHSPIHQHPEKTVL